MQVFTLTRSIRNGWKLSQYPFEFEFNSLPPRHLQAILGE